MTASISSYNLSNLLNTNQTTCVTKCQTSLDKNFEALMQGQRLTPLDSKNSLWKLAIPLEIDTYDKYTSARQQLTDTTGMTESDYKTEYQDYMKSRGCDSAEELKILNNSICNTKEEFIGRVKPAIQAVASTLDYSSGISISNEQVDSMLSEASMQNISAFYHAPASSFAERVSTFQTLLSNISQQDDVSNSVKSSLGSLSQNITNSNDSIIKCSDKIEAENAKSPRHRPTLNSEFEMQKHNVA